MRIAALMKNAELRTSGNAKLKTTIQLTVVITIIVFAGVRIIALHYGYKGPLVDISYYNIFFNTLVSIAVVFTVYSWIHYIIRGRTG